MAENTKKNNKKKKNREQQIGFRLSDLLSPEEVAYARAEARGLKFEVDADAFVAVKMNHRDTNLGDVSEMDRIIKKIKPLEIKKREETKEVTEETNEAEVV